MKDLRFMSVAEFVQGLAQGEQDHWELMKQLVASSAVIAASGVRPKLTPVPSKVVAR